MDVFFIISNDERFSIEVGYFDTVLAIKEKIQRYKGLPVACQTLVFNGQVMSDKRDTEFYEVLQGSEIQLILKPESSKPFQSSEQSSPTLQVQVKIQSSKRQFTLIMEPGDTVGRLKDRIQEAEGIPTNRFSVFLGNVELQDQKLSLGECGVSEQSEITVAGRPLGPGTTNGAVSKKVKIMVQPKCGTKKIPVEVSPNDKVRELRKELQRLHHHLHFHLPQDGYFFIYKQNVMEEDQTFRWHEVRQGDTIEIFNGSVTGGS
ncbi:ubiquitin domain-containing protein 7SL RNA1-like [Aristolochia californica]|uniref:ubiquitin domain-containing protein 7SL RNA1-like n=1 Tax=Aristolochia californica TaxID=171875 RepID=UPI0035DBF822